MSKGFKWLGAGLYCFILSLAGLGQSGDLPYRLSDNEVRQILHTMDTQSERFRHSLGNSLDKSSLNGSSREDDINAYMKDFDKETGRLKDRFDHHKSVAADVQSVLDKANSIERFVIRHPLSDRAQSDWSNLRASLDQLAAAYNVSWSWDGHSTAPEAGSDVPNRTNDKDVARILERVEKQANKFRSSVDSSLDRSRLNGTSREDDINAYMKEFDKETRHLRDQFDHHRAAALDVQAVLDGAARIEQFSRRYPLSARAQTEWTALKLNLDDLAQAYNVSWRWDSE